jgi:hypothetical protein
MRLLVLILIWALRMTPVWRLCSLGLRRPNYHLLLRQGRLPAPGVHPSNRPSLLIHGRRVLEVPVCVFL